MFLSKRFKLVGLLIVLLALSIGCALQNGDKKQYLKFTNDNLSKLELKIVGSSSVSSEIYLDMEFTNGTEYLITENIIFINYPFKDSDNIYEINKYNTEAKGNQKNIEPGEKIILKVKTPYNDDTISKDIISYKIKGFFINSDEDNSFFIHSFIKIEDPILESGSD